MSEEIYPALTEVASYMHENPEDAYTMMRYLPLPKEYEIEHQVRTECIVDKKLAAQKNALEHRFLIGLFSFLLFDGVFAAFALYKYLR